MRIILYFAAVSLLASGIAAVFELRHLPVVMGVTCALMHLLVAFAFLLPVLPVAGKWRITGLVSVHLLAGVYLTAMSAAFDRRQMDEISHSVAVFPGSSDMLAGLVEIPYNRVKVERDKVLRPAHSLIVLDFVWLVGLLGATKSASMSPSARGIERTAISGLAEAKAVT